MLPLCHIRTGLPSTATTRKKREIRSVYIFSERWEISFRAPLFCWTSRLRKIPASIFCVKMAEEMVFVVNEKDMGITVLGKNGRDFDSDA